MFSSWLLFIYHTITSFLSHFHFRCFIQWPFLQQHHHCTQMTKFPINNCCSRLSSTAFGTSSLLWVWKPKKHHRNILMSWLDVFHRPILLLLVLPILWPLYRTTCISQHPQLRTGWFCWSKVLLPAWRCWRQLAHSDEEWDARVLLNGVTCTVSIPPVHIPY